MAVTESGVAYITDKIVQSGGSVTLTAVPTNGYDFVGWYDSANTLLSTATEIKLSKVTAATTLTAKASNTFDAVITLKGDTSRTITLQSGSETAIQPTSGTTFQNLERAKTYKVLDNGVDTGFTVSKNAPNVTLQYYSVTLTGGSGISNLSPAAKTYYLAGSKVDISATVASEYTFTGWSGTASFAGASTAIPAINKDYTLTASTYQSYTGADLSIKTGSIVITDGSTSGTLKITQGSDTYNNIDPAENITITGSGETANTITISATLTGATAGSAVRLTLKAVNINCGTNGAALTISSGAGAVNLLFEGDNFLYAFIGLKKENDAELTIGSVDGTTNHSLTALGQGAAGVAGSTGIGNSTKTTVKSIAINSGKVKAGGAIALGAWQGTTQGITLNGGLLDAWCIGSVENTGTVSGLTINGGTLIFLENGAYRSTSIMAGTVADIKFTGGSIHATSGSTPTNGSKDLAMVTVTTDEVDMDASTLTLTKDGASYPYGTKDLYTDGTKKLFLWLPEGDYTLTLGEKSCDISVPTDTEVVPVMKYSLNTPAAQTVNGVTLTPAVSASSLAEGATATVTVTRSGTALSQGKFTLGLTGTGIGTVAAQEISVTAAQSQSGTKTFTFTMPAANISNLALTVTFAETPRHTVTYFAPDATGGSVPATVSYYEGEQYTIAGNTGTLARTGYTFKSWDKSGQQTMGTENVTLTAQWTPNTYTVTFKNGGGTGNDTTQSFTYGVEQKLTANPFTKDGYTFAGWAKAANGAKAYSDKDSISIAAATDLYALWTPKTYTVTFKNGGGVGGDSTQTFLRDTAQELTPNSFTREGYTFTGWKDASGTDYLNGASVTFTADKTLTAQWTGNPFTVKFNPNGGTGSMNDQSFVYGTTQALNANGFTRTGYTFAGWAKTATGTKEYDNSAEGSALTAVSGSTVTLYAVWTANPYTVKFDANTGSGSMDNQSMSYGQAAALTENTAITRTGYTFGGWATTAAATVADYADKQSVKNLTDVANATVPLYAVWAANMYTLSFHAGGGSGAMPDQTFVTGDDTTTVSQSTFTKAGHHFTGWTDENGAAVAAAAKVNTIGRTAALTAQWAANTYTVKFDPNGGTGSMGNQSFSYGTAKNLTANSFARSGYQFLGWAESPVATAATYTDGASVSNLTSLQGGTVTLYAVWKSNTFAVSFNANGGQGLMTDQTVTNGASCTLPQSSFTKAGYKFAGWNTQPSGAGDYYPAGAAVSFTPDSSGRVSLYAMWTLDARYNISGRVTDDATPTPAAVSGATLTLKQGNTVVATATTNAGGQYAMTNIAPGTYNLVAAKDGRTVTVKVTVEQADVTANVTLPSAGTHNSVLVITNEAGQAAPAVVVGGLETVAQAQGESITMTVTAKAEDAGNAQQTAIKTAVGGQTLAQLLDITLMKGIADIGSTNTTVLELVLPYDFSGKTDVKVWRYHGGAAQELEKQTAQLTSPFADGKYFADSANGLIYVYADKFSTYAVSYTAVTYSSSSGSSSHSILIDESGMEHGTVTANKTTAAAGTKVTVTVSPDSGYSLHHLTVTDASGKAIVYTDNGDGTCTFTMPSSKTTVSASFVRLTGLPFTDVAQDAYYYNAVLWAVDRGITSGVTETAFQPDQICTRAQAVTFLWSAMGSPQPTAADCPFTDLSRDAYYYKAVLWATEQGITAGTSPTTFSPNATVTRAQAVTFLWSMAGSPAADGANPFGDVSADAYYVHSVLWAVEQGITSGTGADAFRPVDGCTRAQIITFLWSYMGK